VSRKQVGALPMRRKKNGVPEILLVTTRRGCRWIIPKGQRSSRLSDCEAAAREAAEEGGVTGQVEARKLGEFTHRKRNGKRARVKVFLLAVKKEKKRWPEQNERRRAWVSPRRAGRILNQPDLKELIERL
jgi:8-oxo-dGTP pyrophosphatase MutT (NUDIX family)